MHSEQDLRYAAELREEIHREALGRVRAVYPHADHVADGYAVEDYFQQVWDYPGQWYTVVGTPPNAGGRKSLVDTIVRETIEEYRNSGAVSQDGFSRLLKDYQDLACDYCLLDGQNPDAREVFPYRGKESHRLALEWAARQLLAGEWAYDLRGAKCRKLSGKALFAPVNSDQWLNYRKAFLCPPWGTSYTDRDFDRVNAALFPGGVEGLEVYRWTTDWSEYFDDGHEWWGTLCLTVYDGTLDRFVVILASATD